MASSGGGGGRAVSAGRATSQRATGRPAPVKPAPRRVAMPKPGPNGTYRTTAAEFERATGRRVRRGR